MGILGIKLTIREVGVKIDPKRAQNDPFVSTLGVKMVLNIVNMPEWTPLFPL